MSHETPLLLATAVSIGTIHTLLGPDHYIPFVAMGRAARWSLRKTLLVTALCGVGHVGSSVVLGVVGIALGIVVFRLEQFEAVRGDLAAWLLIGVGLAYTTWGLVRALRNIPHSHVHVHADGTVHRHPHTHDGEHLHTHGEGQSIGPWVLFTVFLFGPCEPLIPLLMYPAARLSGWAVAAVAVAFGAATLVAMMASVAVLHWSLPRVSSRVRGFERFSHAAAGFSVLLCGVLILAGL